MDNKLHLFKQEIMRYDSQLGSSDWAGFKSELTPVSFKRGATIFPSTELCKHVLWIEKGITAAEYVAEDKSYIIRFFKEGGLCTNVSSILSGVLHHDRIFGLTEVKGVLIPKHLFLNHYLEQDGLGFYLRKRLLEIVLEDKELLLIKTVSGVNAKLEFLQKKYPEVILEVPWKYIASFMGVSPEWLSRSLTRNGR